MKFDVGKIKATIRLKIWILTFWNNREIMIYLILKPWVKL